MKINNNYTRFICLILLLVAAAVGIYFAFPAITGAAGYLINLFLPFILAYLFACLVRPLMRLLSGKLKIPSWISALIVMIIGLLIIAGIAFGVVSKIINEVRNIYEQLPTIYSQFMNTFESTKQRLSGIYQSLPQNIQSSMQSFGDDFTSKLTDLINTNSVPVINYASNTAKALPKFFVAFIVFLLAAFFMLSTPGSVIKYFKGHLSTEFKQKWRKLKTEVRLYLGGYIRAQGILMIIVFVILIVGLMLLNVQYALIIALATALLDALPFFGSGAVLWPWALIKFINGDIKFGLLLMLIYVIITIVRRIIEPKLVSSNMGVNPLITLMSMYIGYKLWSIGGMFLGPIVMLLIISLYKAELFDGIISFVKLVCRVIKKEFKKVTNDLKRLGE